MDRAVFTPFSWCSDFKKPDAAADFASEVLDVANGIQTVLQLLEQNDLDKDDDSKPLLLSEGAAGNLMRFAIRSAGLLASSATDRIEWRRKETQKAQAPAQLKQAK
jgi:hypothetical protein